MKCIHCGYTGTEDEVSIHYEYIGGIGNTAVGPLCNDSVSCWKRWDEANGFMDGGEVKVRI